MILVVVMLSYQHHQAMGQQEHKTHILTEIRIRIEIPTRIETPTQTEILTRTEILTQTELSAMVLGLAVSTTMVSIP